MRKQFQICRAAELTSLPLMRDFIDSAVKGHPEIDEQTTYDLKLAVDEACTNIITHGYSGMDPGTMILNLEVNENQVKMKITDFGHAFEPSDAPKPDVKAALEDRPLGGFGLYFIYQTMDGVDYTATEDGNSLTLVKRLGENPKP